MAAAEHFEYEGTASAERRALSLDPGNEFFIARNAEMQANLGDPSTRLDAELRRAMEMNPRDSSALMTLGLRAEERGDPQAAVYLERAAEVDHTYKPAWTLLNYYFRAGRYDLAWPVARRCLLMIQPRDATVYPYDPAPVFDILWHMSNDPARILRAIPRRSATLVPYLAWLASTNRAEAGIEAWPEALRVADLSSGFDTGALEDFCNFLISANRALDAVAVWNALAGHKVIAGTRLDPAAGTVLEDPAFQYPAVRMGFGWMLTPDSGEFAVIAWHNLRLDFTGDQPESSRVMLKMVPVLSGRRYVLAWKADGTRVLSSPESASGLYFRVVDPVSKREQRCAPLVSANSCTFDVDPGTTAERLDLLYSRALGSTRVQGAVLISRVDIRMSR